VEVRPGPPEARGVAVGEHGHDLIETLARQVPVRPRRRESAIQLALGPFLTGGIGDALLRQDVERRRGYDDAVELAAADASNQRGSFDQLVPRQGKEPPLRDVAQGVAR